MTVEIYIKEYLFALESGNQQLLLEPVHEKTNNLHKRKQSRRSASR